MSASSTLLDSVNAALLAIAGGRVSSYTLTDGTVVTNLDVGKLMEMRSTLQAEVAAESAEAGTGFTRLSFGRG